MLRRALSILTVALMALLLSPGQASAVSAVKVNGTFTVVVLTPPSGIPVGSDACLLTANVRLSFAGTLVGEASGPITILSQAPCDRPPTAGDVFVARLSFGGTIAGTPASTRLLYGGQTSPKGAVIGTMVTTDLPGLLDVRAQAGVGGSYTGVVRR